MTCQRNPMTEFSNQAIEEPPAISPAEALGVIEMDASIVDDLLSLAIDDLGQDGKRCLSAVMSARLHLTSIQHQVGNLAQRIDALEKR